eukprot:85613-Ditylum_brightwellii.AAC.1
MVSSTTVLKDISTRKVLYLESNNMGEACCVHSINYRGYKEQAYQKETYKGGYLRKWHAANEME